MSGGVYIIQNPLFPEYIKVGSVNGGKRLKKSDFENRFRTLNTASPFDFVPLALYAFSDYQDALNAEKGFHKTYGKYRVRINREFFHSAIFGAALKFFDANIAARRLLKKDISPRAKNLNLIPSKGFPIEWIFQERELFYRDDPKIRAVVCSKNEVQAVLKNQRSLPISLSALTKQLKGGRGNYNGFLYWNDCKTGLPLR
ncbi:MAG: GIY-YIG nuclease family protein [Opitutales bacterium]|nr:GIY-YIG nuclease family protein [Opitutales bacterium]